MNKVVLHLHLDGSIDPSLASKLSNKSIKEVKKIMVAPDKCLDLKDYLKRFDFPISLMQSKENLYLIAKSLKEKLIKENVIYAEIRFAPMFHLTNLTYDEVITSVLDGFKSDKIKINLLLCMMRGQKYEDNLNTLRYANKYLGKGVCGIDLAGDEKNFPLKLYDSLFDRARELNIPFTIHAGEARGAEEVEEAINLGARRIGHGIHIIDNKDVINLVKEKDVLLEVCPTSNIQTNSISSFKDHPIRRLFDMGVKLNINTDNDTVSNTNINKEYEKCIKEFKFTDNDLIKMNKDAINSSFIPDNEKRSLLSLVK